MNQLFLQIRFFNLLNVCHLLKLGHVLCLPEYANKFSRTHFILNESINRSFKVNEFFTIVLF